MVLEHSHVFQTVNLVRFFNMDEKILKESLQAKELCALYDNAVIHLQYGGCKSTARKLQK
jgi:hypothetical protein